MENIMLAHEVFRIFISEAMAEIDAGENVCHVFRDSPIHVWIYQRFYYRYSQTIKSTKNAGLIFGFRWDKGLCVVLKFIKFSTL